MKNVLSLLILLPVLAFAEPITIDLQQVPMKDFIRLVYGEILQTSYVVDGTVQDDMRPVSMMLTDVEPTRAETVLKDVLQSQGVEVVKADGLNYIRKIEERKEDKESIVYKPKYRSVQYITELVSSLFPAGAFSSQRSGAMSVNSLTGAGQGVRSADGVLGKPIGQGAGANTNSQALSQGVNRQADNDPDALVFTGNEKDIEKFQKLVKSLDVISGEVMVKAVIYEVKTTKKDGSAIDLAVSILSGKFGITLNAGASDLSNVFFKFGSGSNNIGAMYSALSSDDRFKVVSSPRVRVRSGASAHFSVGDETPVLGSVSYDGEGRPIQSVSYKSSGVIFDLKPQVREEGVDLHLSQQISAFVATTTGVNGSPTLTKRELSTDLTLGDGEIVVIGGLETNSDTKTNSGFSFLPSLFQSESSDLSKTEIVLMLHLQKI